MRRMSVVNSPVHTLSCPDLKPLSKPGGDSLVIALGVALAMCCLPAKADWQLLAAAEQGKSFYDDGIERQGDQISLWRLTNFAKALTNLEGKEVLSEKTRTTLDCAAGKLANSVVMRCSGPHAQGEVMNHYETPLRFTRVAPDSVDALLMQKVCTN